MKARSDYCLGNFQVIFCQQKNSQIFKGFIFDDFGFLVKITTKVMSMSMKHFFMLVGPGQRKKWVYFGRSGSYYGYNKKKFQIFGNVPLVEVCTRQVFSILSLTPQLPHHLYTFIYPDPKFEIGPRNQYFF